MLNAGHFFCPLGWKPRAFVGLNAKHTEAKKTLSVEFNAKHTEVQHPFCFMPEMITHGGFNANEY